MTNADTAPAWSLAAHLPEQGQPWALAFDAWPPALAQKWRALLARPAQGPHALLADRACDPLLLQMAEGRVRGPVRWITLTPDALNQGLAAAAGDFRAASVLDDAWQAPAEEDTEADEISAQGLSAEASPVVRLLDALLYDALQDSASDLHIECHGKGASVRLRIDGVMLPMRQIDGVAMAEQVVSRLKVMSELDIGERRLPQDGRFKRRVQGRAIDFRLSIMPTTFGEDAVVRILDRSRIDRDGDLTLDALGFDPDQRELIRELARLPHGMLLVTGPTGSGKTTTLYATLSEIHTGSDKIITIEDPVEYQLRGVVQIPVNDKKGLTFARGLRSILRHDPDRIMVGEIRDPETAQIAVQAALTGHLVFSTVHANNVFDVIGRFMHMGLDLYNVVSALNAVVAQRLLRQNCPHCSQATLPSPAQQLRFGLDADAAGFRRGLGCHHCRGTGYVGRRAMAELMRLDDGLRDLIAARAPMSQIKEAARQRGMRPIRHAALDAARRGETSLEELTRVTLDD